MKKTGKMDSDLVWLEIDETRVMNNIDVLASQCNGLNSICAVIKGNAYGHGLEILGSILFKHGVRRFAVYHVEEAIKLRKVVGGEGQIIVLGAVVPQHVPELAQRDIECQIMNISDAALFDERLISAKQLGVHIKMDTGMNRYGIGCNMLQEALNTLLESKRLKIVGIASHFSNAWVRGAHTFSHIQMERFDQCLSVLDRNGLNGTVERHMCNTAGLLNYPEAHFQFCRPGIGIMGYYPTRELHLQAEAEGGAILKPILAFKTKIVSIKSMKAGDFAGYDLSYQARTDKKIAILPVGYSDGFAFSHSGTGSYVLIKGQRATVIGRVNMNALIIDVDDIPGVQIGDVATMLGEDMGAKISVWDWLEWGTPHLYESLTKMRSSLPRYVVNTVEGT